MSINHNYIIPKKPKASKNEHPLEKPAIILINGHCGSGKSTLIANLLMVLDDLHDFDNSLFVTGNNRDSLLESLSMEISSSPQRLEDWMVSIAQPVDQPQYNLVVLDDVQSDKSFNIMSASSAFTKMSLSHRHWGRKNDKGGTYIIVTCQTYRNSYTPVFKKMVNFMFIFYPTDTSEYNALLDISGDKEKMKKALAQLKIAGKFHFLYINKQDKTNVRYFIDFDRELQLD